ncbi:D-2-hydroxyacid dehydrogenase family protein [Bifidobacterium leontopitheci]|nr:D-2-hydroxyacid dehydrogenase family protein [Bifidobacterium leontopitheci]
MNTNTIDSDVIETQPERTDLPLVVAPVIVESMIEPFAANFPLLHDIARVRMYRDFTLDKATIIERAAQADAVIVIGWHVTDDMLDALTVDNHVRCFAFGGTGVASYIDMATARERGIRVCNVRHYGDHAVAEHAWALILELARRVGELDAQVKAGSWSGVDGIGLHGKTLGLAGFGGIGQTMARIANGFGMRTLVWNSHVHEDVARKLGVTTVDDMGDLFERSDVVSLHLPLLDETAGIVTGEQLERLRPGTLFVNTARAEIIEPGALAKRLARGDVRAALDVFDEEPLPADDPLRAVPDIVFTPHVAWRDDEACVNLTRQVVDALASFFTGGDYNVVK